MKAVKTILVGIITFALIYLMIAFIKFDLNAENWGGADRFLVVSMGSVCALLTSSFYYFDLNK